MPHPDLIISIIIPVYNVGEYLEDCLMSCLRQDISSDEYEILCIDDGSTDSSGEMLRQFADEYHNIRVFTADHQGVSHARNIGLDHAKGKYIWFVDSDDVIRYNILGKLKSILCETNIPRLKFNAYRVFSEKFDRLQEAVPDSNIIFDYLWRNILRKEEIDLYQIRFIEGLSLSEDTLFLFEFRNRCSECLSLDETVYFYRWRKNSLTYDRDDHILRTRLLSTIKILKIAKSKFDDPIYNKEETFQLWKQHIVSFLKNDPKMNYSDRKELLLRLKAESPWLNNLKPEMIKNVNTRVYHKAKMYSAVKHFEILFYANSVGAHLICLRRKLSDTFFIYYLRHPRRFLRHPIGSVKAWRKKKNSCNTSLSDK